MYYNPILEELVDAFRKAFLWFQVHLIYSTKELQWEANYWYEHHTYRIKGWHSFKDIEALYPEERWRRLKIDLVMAYGKASLPTLIMIGFILLRLR